MNPVVAIFLFLIFMILPSYFIYEANALKKAESYDKKYQHSFKSGTEFRYAKMVAPGYYIKYSLIAIAGNIILYIITIILMKYILIFGILIPFASFILDIAIISIAEKKINKNIKKIFNENGRPRSKNYIDFMG